MKRILIILLVLAVSCTKEEVKPVVQNAHAGELPYITAEIWGIAKEGGHAIQMYTKSNYPIYAHIIFRKGKHDSYFQVVHYDVVDYEVGSYWFPTKENKRYEYYGYAQLLYPQFYAYTDTIRLPK